MQPLKLLLFALGTLQGQQTSQSDSQRVPPPAAAVVVSSTADERIAEYTLWLTLLTGVMAVLGVLQWWTANQQRKISDLQRGIMDRQSTIMESQSALIGRQVAADLRPRVVVRRVFYAKPEDGRTPAINVELADIGQTPARIRAGKIAIIPTMHIYEREPWRFVDALEQHYRLTEVDMPQNGSFLLIHPIAPEDDREFRGCEFLYCVGYVEYGEADSPVKYRLGFIRRADPKDRIFRAADHPEFEYAD